MRIVFLTNTYSPTAVSYIRRLIEAGEEVVGIFLLQRMALKRRGGLSRIVKRYGWGHIVRRLRGLAATLLRYRLARAVRKLGIRSRRGGAYRSVEEFLLDHPRLRSLAVKDLNSAEALEALKALKPDIIFISTLSQILKGDILKVAPLGCVNIHAGLLPKYRGPASNFWVLYNGEDVTGVTFHYLAEKVDAGDIILRRELAISAADTETTLDAKLARLGAEAITQVIALIKDGKAGGCPQPEGEASYFPQPRARDRQLLARKRREGQPLS